MADGDEPLIIKGNRIVLPDCISSGSISVKNGKIVGIEKGLHTNDRTSEAKVKIFIEAVKEYCSLFILNVATTEFAEEVLFGDTVLNVS